MQPTVAAGTPVCLLVLLRVCLKLVVSGALTNHHDLDRNTPVIPPHVISCDCFRIHHSLLSGLRRLEDNLAQGAWYAHCTWVPRRRHTFEHESSFRHRLNSEYVDSTGPTRLDINLYLSKYWVPYPLFNDILRRQTWFFLQVECMQTSNCPQILPDLFSSLSQSRCCWLLR